MDWLAYSIGEAAEMLGISPNSVRRLIERGDLRTARLGERRVVVPAAALRGLLAADDEARNEHPTAR